MHMQSARHTRVVMFFPLNVTMTLSLSRLLLTVKHRGRKKPVIRYCLQAWTLSALEQNRVMYRLVQVVNGRDFQLIEVILSSAMCGSDNAVGDDAAIVCDRHVNSNGGTANELRLGKGNFSLCYRQQPKIITICYVFCDAKTTPYLPTRNDTISSSIHRSPV